MNGVKNEVISVDEVKSLSNIKAINKRVAIQIFNDAVQCGFLHYECLLNNDKNVFAIETDFEVKDGTDGTFNDISLFECKNSHGILVDKSANFLELNPETHFVIAQIEDVVSQKGTFNIEEEIIIKIKSKKIKGKIFLSGRINNIFCYAVVLDKSDVSEENDLTCIVIENHVFKLSSSLHEEYLFPRYSIECGDDKGIQGNLNSCYLDTSIFSIFTFNTFLDNMLLDRNGDDHIRELRDILRTEIVYPLRKYGYVSYVDVTKFRDKLQSLSPDGKFVINERDPEEFLEQLFKLLTPNKYILRTKPFQNMDNEQKCFLTQLFYDSEEIQKINLQYLFTLTFLEFGMFISKPPKCLILQLPRDGRDFKKFKRVYIPSRLDITSFIIACPKTCRDCTTTDLNVFFCQTCSKLNAEMTYFCKDHKLSCIHDKIPMSCNDSPYEGSVVLDLVSILCIERTHYISYVKTNDVRGKWVYFNSMEKFENGRFIPHVRETILNNYFNNKNADNVEYDKDVDKIENYAFICVYKYSVMEIYDTDFNSDRIN